MRSFILGTFNSLATGCRITNPPVLTPTARVVDEVEIIGGEGRLMRPRGWSLRTLTIGLLAPTLEVIDRLAGVCATPGVELRLSHLPGRFFLTASSAVSELTRFGTRFQATLEIACRPFTYLESGLTPITLPAGGSVRVTNPSLIPARPTIILTGSGQATFRIGATPYTVRLPGSGELVIDCEARTCTVSGQIALDALTATDFPVLPAGAKSISLPVGVSGRLLPRWRLP